MSICMKHVRFTFVICYGIAVIFYQREAGNLQIAVYRLLLQVLALWIFSLVFVLFANCNVLVSSPVHIMNVDPLSVCNIKMQYQMLGVGSDFSHSNNHSDNHL